ncbi:MAG: hypothetical protein J6U23_02030 [Clostridiales bacterium]|nr:hypothetical protein [Clostridiales bacterium]
MSREKTGLSPLPYIKNNKRRILALVISISLFGTMLYVLGYFLGTFQEPYGEPVEKMYDHVALFYEDVARYVPEDYVEDPDLSFDEKILPLIEKEAEEVSGDIGEEVLVVRRGVFKIESTVGMQSVPLYYFQTPEDVKRFYDKCDMELVEGRMPQNPGELVVDEVSFANQGDELFFYINKNYKIVGKVRCDSYAFFGLPLSNENNYMCMILHDENDIDYKEKLTETGHELSFYYDKASQIKFNEEDMASVPKIKLLFTGVSVSILLVCVIAVLALHIRDRHEEWCLLNSIGYSVTDVYLMAIKELLICFAAAAITTFVLSVASVLLIKTLMIDPKGFSVRMIRLEDISLITEAFLAVFALCNIPIFIQLRKITTIDDIE